MLKTYGKTVFVAKLFTLYHLAIKTVFPHLDGPDTNNLKFSFNLISYTPCILSTISVDITMFEVG